VFALPPGTYQVTTIVDGEGLATAVVTVPGASVALTLSGSGTLVGRARGIDDGSFALTVASCATDASAASPLTRHLVTVRGGNYRLDGVPACRVDLVASNRVRQRHYQVAVEAGAVTSLDIDLSPPRPKTIRGVVRDEDGRPQAGLDVNVMSEHLEDAAATTTDRDGRFTVEARGGDMILFWNGAGRAELTVSDDDPDQRDVDIVLEPGGW
jgi:hypothetical protein